MKIKNIILKKKFQFILFPLLLILSACGGGGSGGGAGSSTTRSIAACTDSGTAFQTAEYYALGNTVVGRGLSKICASNAYARGYTGSGVKVGILDTGITTAAHQEFDGSGKRNYDTGSDLVSSDNIPQDGHGHGTHVAGIIGADKDNTGMHGVAYGASLYHYRIFNDAGTTTNTIIANGIQKAIDNGGLSILNHSWGTAGSCTSQSSCETGVGSTVYAKIVAAAQANIIQVFSAGNENVSSPSYEANSVAYDSRLQGVTLAVAAVGTDGVIANYSNKCGTAASYCLAAPGSFIYSTYISGTTSYELLSGTSMAAPLVSGSLAILKQQFTSLTNTQLVTRLLESATNTGIYSDTSIYGYGLLNLGQATTPMGVLQTLSGSNNLDSSSASYIDLSSTSFISSASFSNALKKSLNGKQLEVYDSFDQANFKVALSDLIGSKSNVSEFNAASHFNRLKPKDKSEIYLSPFGQTEATYVNGQLESNLFTSYNNFLAIGYNQDTNSFLKNEKTNLLANDKIFSKNYFNNPYFYNEGGSNFFMSLNNNQSGLDTFMNSNSNDLGFAMKFNNGEKLTEDGYASNLEFSFGVSAENKKFLNSSSSGAFATEDFSNTNFLGLKYNKTVQDLNFVSSIYMGQTFINEKESSYLSGSKPIYTSSLTMGVIKDNFYDPSQKIGFVMSQPQKVEKGEINLRVPTSSNRDRNVSYTTHNVDLKPDARQVNLDLIFEKSITEMENLKLGLTHVQNADHSTESKNQNFISAYWQKRF
jgi:hypothetical protein